MNLFNSNGICVRSVLPCISSVDFFMQSSMWNPTCFSPREAPSPNLERVVKCSIRHVSVQHFAWMGRGVGKF